MSKLREKIIKEFYKYWSNPSTELGLNNISISALVEDKDKTNVYREVSGVWFLTNN